MIKGKSIGISAGCGFVLSFLTGIISSNTFAIVVLRALGFALVFAVLSVGISLIYEKFLSDGEDFPELKPGKSTAGNVDIVVSDENLEDDSGPQFFVENNRQKLKGDEIDTVENLEAISTEEKPEVITPVNSFEENKTDGFVPVNLGSAPKISSVEGETSLERREVPQNNADSSNKTTEYSDGTSIEDIDELPDIADLSMDKKNSDIGDIIEDSDFAAGSSSSIGKTLPNGSEVSIQNADVMAGAIRTLLSKDNQ